MRTTLSKMSAAVTSNTRHFDTIVIGAGISGLACAARLLERGQGSVAILEGRDRIGGRISSVYVNGNRLDEGANWIHGIGTKDDPNPLMDVLPHKRYKELDGMVAFRPADVAVESNSRESSAELEGWQKVAKDASSQHSETGKDLVVPAEHAGTLMSAVWGSIDSLHEIATKTSAIEGKRTTMLSVVAQDRAFRDAFEKLPSAYHSTLSGLPQFLEPIEAAPLAAQSAEHDQDAPGMSLLEYAIDDFEGDQVFLRDGYTAVIDEVAKDLIKARSLHLDVNVERIVWDTNPVTIETGSGTYTAKSVVCTIPLGVLKPLSPASKLSVSQHKSFFKPDLPQDKAEAISSLGFGTLDKVFLVYKSPWWREEPFATIVRKGNTKSSLSREQPDEKHNDSNEPDSFMGFTHNLPGIAIGPDGTVSTGPRLLSLMNLNSLCGFPVLSCFVSCANAVHMENLPEDEAADLIHGSLCQWFGREVPRYEAAHVTKWATDKHSLGSYSHMITGLSETRHRECFQHPLRNKHGATLAFAGEHTSRNHFATAHGALISGRREADRILKENLA